MSSIGVQRQYNYALRPMSKEAFIAVVTADQPESPDYFSYDAEYNLSEHSTLDEVLDKEGWFRTGDEGIIDQQQYLTLVGRIKELINRSGEKISPLEIDDILLGHPSVAEAVSFGIPHPTYGEEPAACVVLNGDATSQDLVKYCREHLADFKVPKNIHIVDEIPKTATGKVQRRFVAAAFIKE